MVVDTSGRRASALIAIALLLAGTTLVFAYLWLGLLWMPPCVQERVVEKPVEVIREVQVEKVREVPVTKEVVVTREVEVPAKLTEAQQAAVDFASRLMVAPLLSSPDDVFYKLDAVRVDVYTDEAVRKVLTDDAIRNRFELILRQLSIPIDPGSPVTLAVYAEGQWDPQEAMLTWTVSAELQQIVTLERRGDMRRTNATIWRDSSSSQVRNRGAHPALLMAVQSRAESFANKYLAAQGKTQ
jgi:hypothetical protein